MGVALVITDFSWVFPYKPYSYWGIPHDYKHLQLYQVISSTNYGYFIHYKPTIYGNLHFLAIIDQL